MDMVSYATEVYEVIKNADSLGEGLLAAGNLI